MGGGKPSPAIAARHRCGSAMPAYLQGFQGDVFGEIMLALEKSSFDRHRRRQTSRGASSSPCYDFAREEHRSARTTGIWEIQGRLAALHPLGAGAILRAAFECGHRAVREPHGLEGPVKTLDRVPRDSLRRRGDREARLRHEAQHVRAVLRPRGGRCLRCCSFRRSASSNLR